MSAAFRQAGAQGTQVLTAVPDAVENTPLPQVTYQPMTFRVYNPETGKYEETALQNMQVPTLSVDMPQNSVTQSAAYRYNYPAVPDAVPGAPTPKQEKKEKKPAKKRSEMTKAEQLLDSFTQSATTAAGRELGRNLSRSLLGLLGLKK